MSGGGTNTVQTSSAPPQQYLQAFSDVNAQAQNAASVPYTPYTGQTVAQLSPDQTAAFGQVENLTANGGVQAPYLDQAAQYINNAATGINPANFGSTVSQYESPYTKDVVNATEQQFNNQNAIQQQGVIGNAVSSGAWGGDRSAVAQALTAGQQQTAEAPVIAGLENTGFQNATQTAEANQWLQSQAGAGMANLGNEAQATGLSGASALLQSGGLQQQMAQENLNIPYEQYTAAQAYPFQTTGWLANIAEGLGGASGGTSSTTSPAASTASQLAGLGAGTAGILGSSGAFGQNGWLTGGSKDAAGSIPAGGTGYAPGYEKGGSVTRPHSLGLGGFGHGIPVDGTREADHFRHNIHIGGMGTAPHNLYRASGGGVPDVSLSIMPSATGLGGTPTPANSSSIVPGASGMGAAPLTHGTPDILKNYGSTSTTTGGPTGIGAILGTAGQIAAGIYGGPAGAAAAGAFNQAVGVNRLRTGGLVQRFDTGGGMGDQPPWYTPLLQEQLDQQLTQSLGMARGGETRQHFDIGGMSLSQADPSWTRDEESASTGRHGLLASPIAGRTDKLAISPVSGSYIVPADVISGLGEGNTLAGANVMQRILETGPHGLRMPNSARGEKGIPRPPPAYREGMGDNGMASGGMVSHYDDGGGVDGPDDVYNYAVDTEALPVPPIPPSSGGMGPKDTGSPVSNVSRFHAAEADPWLALAQAGFGMAAGRSPHALENIGAGAEQGVKSYVQQKQQADQRNLQAQELQARLADTAAYREGLLGVRGQTADAALIRANAYDAFTQRKADLQAQGLDEKTANDRAMQDWRNGTLGVQQQNADTRATGVANNLSLGQQRIQQRAQQLQQTADFKAADQALRARLGDNANTNAILSRATTLSAATGKPIAESVQQILAQQPKVRQALPSVGAGPNAPVQIPPAADAPPVDSFFR